MAMQRGPTRLVAEYVADTKLGDIPIQAIDGAKLSILDTLGCGLAALDQSIAQEILGYVKSLGGEPSATILGSAGYKTAPPLAAMANGCLVNILDYDGWFHAPTHTLPAALAVGEMLGASGADVLEAYILATEVADRLQRVIEAHRNEQAGPTYRGWYHVSLYGPLTASLAAGKLLKLDALQLQGAMGAAACGSGGVRQNLGAKAKSFNSGNAASVGVNAAMLAQRGVTGDANILEARVGLVNAVCLPGEFDWDPIVSGLSGRYHLDSAHLATKKYPAVGPTQNAIGTLAKLCSMHQVSPDDVESIEAHVPTFSATAAEPEDELAAGFSWPYILGATVIDRDFTVDHLTRSSITDGNIRAMAAKVRLIPPTSASDPERIAVHLLNGRTIETTVDPQLGRIDREGLLKKYRHCASHHLAETHVQELYERVMGLEELSSIGQLTAAMSGPRFEDGIGVVRP